MSLPNIALLDFLNNQFKFDSQKIKILIPLIVLSKLLLFIKSNLILLRKKVSMFYLKRVLLLSKRFYSVSRINFGKTSNLFFMTSK